MNILAKTTKAQQRAIKRLWRAEKRLSRANKRLAKAQRRADKAQARYAKRLDRATASTQNLSNRDFAKMKMAGQMIQKLKVK